MTTIHKKITVEKEVIDDIICNKCHQSLKVSGGYSGMAETFAEGDEGSKYFEPKTLYCFSLCEDCVHELFLSFTDPPQKI